MKNLFLLSILLFAVGCKSSQTTKNKDVVISMQKTGCMGQCPVYTLEIYDNGIAYLNAEKYLEKEGEYQAEISMEKLMALIKEFEEKDFFNYKRSYTSRMSDLPTTYLYFSHNGKSHRVEDYDNAPESLKELEKEVSGLIDTLKWERKN